MTTGRRANHEGEEPKLRPDGRWRARYIAADGSRREVYSRISAADCRTKRNAAMEEARSGLMPADKNLTLGQWMTSWIDTWIDDGEHDRRTVHNYQTNLRIHLAPITGRRVNGQYALTPSDIKAVLKGMERAGKSGTTRQLVFDQLKAAYTRGVLDRRIAENICLHVPRPRRDTPEASAWTEEQLNLFLDAVAGDRLEAAWNVMLLGGLRQGEVVGLRWSDIDWDANRIRVAGQLDRFSHQWKKRKGRSKAYEVPMPEVLVDLLKARRVAQMEEQLRAGPRWTGNEQDLVFTTRYGTPIPHNNIGQQWRDRVAKVEGLPPIKFHGSRHSYASVQFERGAQLQEVGALLGQDDRTTTRMYIHLSERTSQAAAQRMNLVRPRKKASA